ncbi:GIY-YIG nuclease family protein [Micromonospora avicenniae]|uniref:GIY-YIG catalytic domain-containing protein n=1 Tax=Micromonospora avicenniae TaxID=1198245 RepID=A0A1N7EZV8_9ACTN|nr:hypothetical protein [Micromonospora avicenniae]SIR93673.1 hypothetical protein SAMN05444858_12915 [Micromonospora avicenniae]
MPVALIDDLLAGFTPAQPYNADTAASAPAARGVHVVLDGGTVVYVGWTGNLRRRLRQHLTGSRDSSVLHEQVGQLLDTPTRAATAEDIAGWLGRREVRWQETENPEGTKDALVLALMPVFNRQVPKPRRTT